ncbi:MAG: leucine-rich repeat protein [Alistipes sp.]|nr:leucine-rich repeat protein [Alistipes sp.]
MKKLLFLLPILMLCGCDSDNGINYEDEKNSSVTVTEISLSPSEMVVGSENGSCSVSVWLTTDSYSYYNEPEWKLTGGASWCNPYKISGRGNDVIEFKVYENPDLDDRSATFTITCQNQQSNFTIIQRGQGINTITGTPAKIDVEAVGGDIDIEIKANIDYTYKIDSKCKEWITATDGSANGKSRITLNVAPNPESKERQGVITITSSDITEQVTIIQNDQPYIILNKAEYEIPGKGDIIAVEIMSNVGYNVNILHPSWIKEVKNSSTSANILYFEISSNPYTESRNSQIKIMANNDGDIYAMVYITQHASSLVNINVQNVGTLSSVMSDNGLDADNISMLKISGVLNDEDFLYIRNMPNLKSLDISDVNIPQLPNRAFYVSKTVENIVLPKTLSIIGDYMFYSSNVKSVVVYDKVTEIGESAFAYSQLQSIEIPANVEKINKEAFYYCAALNSVVFEKGSKLKKICGGYISSYARHGVFNGCKSLKYIEIPANVETIEVAAFAGCTSLTNVTFEKQSQLKTIGTNYENAATWNADYIVDVGAFYNCTSLVSIEIPANVEIIGMSAFRKCSSLSTVTFEKGSKLKTFDGGQSHSIGAGSDYACGAFTDCTSLTTIEIPASVETIGVGTFKGCTSLTTVTFEKESSLKIIKGDYVSDNSKEHELYGAFSDCTSLTSIEIPASVETIQTAAFSGCTSLTTVTFENGSQLKSIQGSYFNNYRYQFHKGAFASCPLTTIDLSTCKFLTDISDAFSNVPIALCKIGANTPPTCGSWAFSGTVGYSVLKVPTESVEAYKNADGWRGFSSITALDE